jgi:hypothetical protein
MRGYLLFSGQWQDSPRNRFLMSSLTSSPFKDLSTASEGSPHINSTVLISKQRFTECPTGKFIENRSNPTACDKLYQRGELRG